MNDAHAGEREERLDAADAHRRASENHLRAEHYKRALERIANRAEPAYPDEIEIAREALASSPSPRNFRSSDPQRSDQHAQREPAEDATGGTAGPGPAPD